MTHVGMAVKNHRYMNLNLGEIFQILKCKKTISNIIMSLIKSHIGFIDLYGIL